jgi:hypothetical protein
MRSAWRSDALRSAIDSQKKLRPPTSQTHCAVRYSVGDAGVDVPAHMEPVWAAGRRTIVRHANSRIIAVPSMTAIIPRLSGGTKKSCHNGRSEKHSQYFAHDLVSSILVWRRRSYDEPERLRLGREETPAGSQASGRGRQCRVISKRYQICHGACMTTAKCGDDRLAHAPISL